MPSNQIALTSNYQPSLAHLSNVEGMTTFILDGGGFPVEIAAVFGLIKPPQDSFFREYIESVGTDAIFYIPEALSQAWGWCDGEARLGGTIRVVSDIFGDSLIQKFPPIVIRLYAALRLSLAQLVLLFFPILIINASALIPVAILWIISSCLIAAFWHILPGNGWQKGTLIGATCAISAAGFNFFQIFTFPLLFLIGIFIMSLWMGGLFMGARSSS